MKRLPKKYFHRLIGLCVFLVGLATVYIVSALGSTEFRLDDQLSGQFGPSILMYRADIDFTYGGNKKVGMYLPRTLETLGTPETVVLNGGITTGFCYAKVRGLYYNNQRGERLRPMDVSTLSGLIIINSSYSGMQLSGGLFTNCTGLGGTSSNVYGQLTITQNATTYYLMGGTDYNFPANMHGTGLSGSLIRASNILSGYIWDSYGGIGRVLGSSGCVDAWTPSPDTVCSTTTLTQNSVCGNTQVVTGTKNCGGGGGGSHLTQDNCTLNNTSNDLPGANENGIDYSPSYYDHDCEGPRSIIQHEPTPPACTAYNDELNGAYEFARSFDITTIDQCRSANLYGHLVTQDLAKMMVNFATYVFDRADMLVDDPRCAMFSDIAKETPETKYYIQKACEYGLMGLESDGLTPQATFNPSTEVVRKQFGTVLSRFIRLTEFNTNDRVLYYTKHLQALKRTGIMNKISNPTMIEVRGRVMLMMQRIYEKQGY